MCIHLKSPLFDHLDLIFWKIFNCILYSQDLKSQQWYHLVNIAKVYIAIKTHLISSKTYMQTAIGIFVKSCKFQGNCMSSFHVVIH